MELRWLSAPDDEVAVAMAAVRHDSRPSWVPTKRQVLVHVNQCLMLWYLCIVFMITGIRVDSYQDGRVSSADIGGLAVAVAIFAVWVYGAYLLRRWAAKPPSPRARLKEWRSTLTALANGFEPQPSARPTFTSLISTAGRGVREYPRFVAPGIEFGNLVQHNTNAGDWHYLAVTLPAPLPHLILDATSNNRLGSDLPANVDRSQRLSLEGGFDRWFHVYSPLTYGKEALYVLTPDVMAALIDNASRYNVEIMDDTLVFFTSPGADFAETPPWESVDAILSSVAPRIVVKAQRYLDERVPGQEIPRVLAKLRVEDEHPDAPWTSPRPRIGPNGHRLNVRDRHTGPLSILGAVGWFALLTFLYAVPGIFAFAGFMSIVDGR